MRSPTSLSSLIRIFTTLTFLLSTVHAQNNTNSLSLNFTAVAAENGSSVFQCWQLTTPLGISTISGTAGSFNGVVSNSTNVTYTVISPRFDGGFHNAPTPQWAFFATGLIHFTLPNVTLSSETEFWHIGGKYGLIFLADTKEVSMYGHGTNYISDADTIIMQIPVGGVDAIPPHSVLYNGPCKYSELAGL